MAGAEPIAVMLWVRAKMKAFFPIRLKWFPETQYIPIMILEFKRSETVFRIGEKFVERQSTGLKLSKQSIGIGDQNESVPSRPLVPGVVRDRMNIFGDMFQKNPHVITTHDRKERVFFRDEEICLETEFLIVEVD